MRKLCFLLAISLAGLAWGDQDFDVVVYGATPGGISSAITAARMGRTVALVEPQHHVGGMTSSGLSHSDITTKAAIGGIRGLTAVPDPTGTRQSLLFMWHPGRTSKGCIIRLDLGPDGSYVRHPEECLARLVSKHTGVPTPFILGAYSFFTPLNDPSSGEMLHIIGLEAFVPVSAGRELTAHNQHKDVGGFYAGGLYALIPSGNPKAHFSLSFGTSVLVIPAASAL